MVKVPKPSLVTPTFVKPPSLYKEATPGSPEAQVLGCTCPILDNEHGEGFPGPLTDIFGGICFWINQDCPLHRKPKRIQKCKTILNQKKDKSS